MHYVVCDKCGKKGDYKKIHTICLVHFTNMCYLGLKMKNVGHKNVDLCIKCRRELSKLAMGWFNG